MKICVWCKYGRKQGDKLVQGKPCFRDCRQCPRCNRTCISSSHLEEE